MPARTAATTQPARATTVEVCEWRKQDKVYDYHKPITGHERQMEVTVPLSGKARLKFCIAEMEAAHTDYHFSLGIDGADASGNIFGGLTREQLLALPEAIATGFREANKLGMLEARTLSPEAKALLL
jgi:hypothetical protein